MSKHTQVSRALARYLSAAVVTVGMVSLADNAEAFPGSSGAEFGGAPRVLSLSTNELQRMNDETLLDLQMGRTLHVKVLGDMGRYNVYYLLSSIRRMPGESRRLIERIENARNEEEKKEIIDGLLAAAKKRHKASEARLLKEQKILAAAGLLDEYPTILSSPELRNNKRVQAYYALLRATSAKQDFVRLLDSMQSTHSGKFRTIFD